MQLSNRPPFTDGERTWTAQNPMTWAETYRLYKDCGPRLGMAAGALHGPGGLTSLNGTEAS